MYLDLIRALIAAFDDANLVALAERHWARADAEFRLKLIRDAAFAQKVNDIVIEFGNPLYQAVLDGFVNGDDVQPDQLRRVWQDTTQPGAWDSPVYEDFVAAVRTVNSQLSPGRRLQVLAGDYPIDWSAVAGSGDVPDLDTRDHVAAAVIRKEVLDRGRKALVIFGSAHLYRSRPGTIIDLMKKESRASWFVAAPVGGPGLPPAISAIEASSAEPTLINLSSSPWVISTRLTSANGEPSG